MTIKTVKNFKNKGKPLKLKNSKAPQKVVESDSDISDSGPSGNAPKIDKKQLELISTEVTDLLASLKREHGIEDEQVTAPQKGKEKPEKGKKNKKEVKNVEKPLAVAVKKPKEAKKEVKKEQPKKKLTAKLEKPKAKLIKKVASDEDNDVDEEEVTVPIPAPANKKNKSKKRAAEVKKESTDEPQAKKVKNAQKQQQEKKKPADKKVPKTEVKVKEESADETEDTAETAEDTPVQKKEHHLKDAVPVYVGNLPTNVKHLKLTKMFKKFGKVLSIRIRTNKGKTFLRKSQISKVPHLIAFIYFATLEEAQAAVVLDGEKIGDNHITVNLDTKEKSNNSKNTVVVGNLKYAVTAHILREAFKCCGAIGNIRVGQSLKGCNGVAFIQFESADSCALALKLNGTSILDREIRVEKYKAKKTGELAGKKEKIPKVKVGQKKKGPLKNAGKDAQKNGTKAAGDKKQKKKNKEFLGLKSNDAKNVDKKKKKKNKLSNEKRLALKVAPKAIKATAKTTNSV